MYDLEEPVSLTYEEPNHVNRRLEETSSTEDSSKATSKGTTAIKDKASEVP